MENNKKIKLSILTFQSKFNDKYAKHVQAPKYNQNVVRKTNYPPIVQGKYSFITLSKMRLIRILFNYYQSLYTVLIEKTKL